MTCWEILGIESGADKKAIKIAYSKLLKITRPDDDPEGFERLHSAYKSALDSIENPETSHTQQPTFVDHASSQIDTVDTGTATGFSNTSEQTEVTLNETISNSSNNTEQDSLGNELEQEWYQFTSTVTKIVSEQQSANSVDSWEDIVRSPLITDLQFKDLASDYVFDVISQKNVISLENDELYIDSSTLNYLNSYFTWGINWGQLSEKFNQSRLDSVLPFLKEEEKHELPQEAQPHIYSKLVGYFTSLLVIIAGYHHLNLFIVVTVLAVPSTINRVYTRNWQAKNYGRAMGGEDEQVEQSKFILYPTLFIAMWITLLCGYGLGWAIRYLVNLF